MSGCAPTGDAEFDHLDWQQDCTIAKCLSLVAISKDLWDDTLAREYPVVPPNICPMVLAPIGGLSLN